jgi:excinuclease ABC subunit C
MSRAQITSEPASEARDAPALEGAALIHGQLRTLPSRPGVYRMLDRKGEVLYVGKASSLKKRVAAYAKPAGLSARLQRMVALTRALEIVTTSSEVEALLLEANLIKRFRPPFNIVLRDDKSFPYIYVGRDHAFPQIGRHRGAKKKQVDYFGPFASSGAVNETLSALLRAFPLRTCSDSMLASRRRPCLQYQIKRCSAPCVGRIGEDDYARLADEVRAFLGGRSGDIQARLKAEMEEAAESLEFERAASLRDRLKALAHITSRQGINVERLGDADVIALSQEGGQACVQVFFFRGGRNYGNRAYHPAHTRDEEPGDVLDAFIGQFYAERPAPPSVLLSDEPGRRALLEEALGLRAGRKVRLSVPRRGERRRLVEHALTNARQALARRLAEGAAHATLLARLAETLGLPEAPERIEVYDNSHIQGSHATGAFVVAGREGFQKDQYRTFTIREAPGSDDFAMMREVLRRRFSRLVRDDPGRERWPDLVLIDGGAGQLGSARAVLEELGIEGVELVAVAKGPERNAGRERLYRPGRDALSLDPKDPVLYFVQRLRDEAHRFAVASHRGRRGRAIGRSALDRVPGIGAKRKKALLAHFGSVRGIEQAGLLDLERVPGISRAVARTVYDFFHDGG